MSGFLAAAVIASTALSLYGQKKEADAEESALREKARLGGIQADELLARTEINVEQMRKEGKKVVGRFDVAIGKHAGATSEALRTELLMDINDEIDFERRVAEFDANMLRMGAESARRQAKEVGGVSRIRMLGTVLSGGAQIAAGSK